MPSSQNKHYLGTINSWNRKILAISDIDHVTSEMFNTELSTWESFEPLPGAKYAYYLSSVNFREKGYGSNYFLKIRGPYKNESQKFRANQVGHKQCRHRLDMGGQTSPSHPPGSKYFREFCSPSHIKLINNNPNKDLKTVERP